MHPTNPFGQLVGRLRNGDPEAAREIVSRYENEIRRAIRVRLTDPRLRRSLDSMDICQSVLANFFLRIGRGQFDLESPQDLLALLVRMAQNKLIDHARRADARGRQNMLGGVEAEVALATAPHQGETPSEVAANRELLETANRLMSPAERRLAEGRAEGRTWAELAAESASTPEAVRKQLERALDRVATALGIDSTTGPE